MADDIEIDSLLCFLKAAKSRMNNERITKSLIGFYSHDRILQSKEAIFKRFNTKMIKRKACERHPNPVDADVDDLIDLFDKMESDDKMEMPTYVSSGLDGMPSADFDAVAGILCSLRDEIASLRFELHEVRQERERDIKTLEQSDSIMSELSDIKLLCNRNAESSKTSSKSSSSALVRENIPVPSSTSQQANYRDALTKTPGPFTQPKPRKNSNMEILHKSSYPKNQTTKSAESRLNNNQKKGTKLVNINAKYSFSSSNPAFTVYVGRCSRNTTVGGLEQFCKDQDIEVLDIEELQTINNWSKSYKLSVNLMHRDSVMNESFWPEGIIFRKYFFPRKNQNKTTQ